jgi:hypothetical protein
MTLNPYFNQVTRQDEQSLVQDLIIEAIQIYGHEVYYIQRDVINFDTLLGEDDLQLFQYAWPIEMYIKTTQSFQGQSEFVSKFGLIIEDRIDLSCSVKRFHEVVPGMLRPREGDLLWIQMANTSRYLFDIRFVENQEQMFQLGKLYTYELRCERMNFSHERVKTSEPEINEGPQRDAYTLDVMLAAGGAGTYISGETVYQGPSLAGAYATGMVLDHTPGVFLLTLQNITGTFANATAIVGANSGAVWLTSSTPSTAPESHDPISDNAEIEATANTVVVSRGSNPRYQ